MGNRAVPAGELEMRGYGNTHNIIAVKKKSTSEVIALVKLNKRQTVAMARSLEARAARMEDT